MFVIILQRKEWYDLENNFYEGSLVLLEGAIANIKAKLDIIRKYRLVNGKQDPILHITHRIKSEESMKEKLTRRGFEISLENALTKVYDAEMLKNFRDLKVIREKDYIKNPKPSGYRSYHIIFELSLDLEGEITPVFVEMQIRTIAMEFWSSLEHEMKYKKNVKNQELIVEELKRCADEIATIDLNMQTIKKMIDIGENE